MNNELYSILKKENIHPIAYKKINSVYLVSDKTITYAIKLNTNNYDIYKYLLSKGFNYFPDNYSNVDVNYDITKYIIPLEVNQTEKVNDYLKLLSILHFKTSYKREVNLDEIKINYEKIINEINDLRRYYISINDKLDKERFLSPADYLLLRNITLIYSVLNIIEKLLNKTYEKIKDSKSIRVALLHNNLSLDHLIINEGEYLISWDKSYFDSPINELNSFYRKYYNYIDINDFLLIYEKSNKLSAIEKALLIIVLSVPKKIEFINNNYENTVLVNNEINYLKSIYELLTKYNDV